ncbi:MAG: hypothetical protein Q8K45_08045 [Rubrivivax sp.]|nr:hypothetical protein [Rubrivivax sp.]
MTPAADGARARLPRDPYPGLRPFLDFEAALLFGRERQVREVIVHLRESQFVAVLGGSGSGKSSLIRAGVIPELRSFGIPGAGDLWLSMTCTPGTNVSTEDRMSRRVSPITRLARRFAGLLKSRGSDAADAQRTQEIAEVFRQEAGFARLLDTYGAELAVPPGPDPDEARVLFVVDQFEEIFHPTNKGVEDATLLVERVLDHFFSPHPRCHVVLTMRSEHLNDCASFLELPDAINKSSYLVRRLDDDELREAIVGPAQRFLRLKARTEPPEIVALLPPEVRFDPEVLERLLRDVKAITHDPDHLPLLQHLLARLWDAALEREEMDVPVPSHVSEIDLVRAVGGGRAVATGDEQPLDDKVNTLRACVENWPETLYQWQGEKQRAQLDALFSLLAYKDPNTGMYTQQRADIDSAAALLGPGKTRVDLRALLAEGFLGSVDYLFWDEEDPARATLKVSHESFIRGWSRLRTLIDRESDRYEEFVDVLRRCGAWAAGGRSEDLLLESGEMRLLRESGFEARLRTPGQQEGWFRLLQLDRDGVRLGRLQASLDAYLQLSNQRLRVRLEASRTRRRWAWASALLLVFVPPAFFSLYIQGPVMQRAEGLLAAGTLANRVPLTPDYPGVGAAGASLASLRHAAELVDEAHHGETLDMTERSKWLIERLSWLPPVRRQGRFLDNLTAQTEPPVNGKLRQVLTGAVWPAGAAPEGAAVSALPDEMDVGCRPQAGAHPEAVADPRVAELLQGRVYLAKGRNADSRQRRALFVPVWTGPYDAGIELRSASIDSDGQGCRYGPIVTAVPLFLEPRLVIDASLRYVAYSAGGDSVEVPSVTVLEIDWERLEDRSTRVLQAHTRAIVTGRGAWEQLQTAAGSARVAAVPSWRLPGGRALAVGGSSWRLLAPTALRLPASASADFVALLPAEGRKDADAAASAADRARCMQLAAGWAEQPGFRNQVFEQGGRCFHIARGNPLDDNPGPAGAPGGAAAAREQVLVAVYERPVSGSASAGPADGPPAPVASLSPFARVDAGNVEWMVGVRGEHAGWLAVRGKDAAGELRLLGLPWSTCALWRLGRDVDPSALARDSETRSAVCADR